MRGIFKATVGKPTMTILHGQPWGASVAAKAAELYTRETVGEKPYDAVLLTAGVLAGGTRSYDFRMDLSAIYQYLCNNHPRPTEPQYDLNLGFAAGQTPPTNAYLTARVNECLGLNLAPANRTPEQASKIATIVDVVRRDRLRRWFSIRKLRLAFQQEALQIMDVRASLEPLRSGGIT